jgi:hypothetical protein
MATRRQQILAAFDGLWTIRTERTDGETFYHCIRSDDGVTLPPDVLNQALAAALQMNIVPENDFTIGMRSSPVV